MKIATHTQQIYSNNITDSSEYGLLVILKY
jgi:hypothetical protein